MIYIQTKSMLTTTQVDVVVDEAEAEVHLRGVKCSMYS